MKKDPSVNVIMPNYNKGQFIEEAINSVLNQKYDNWKLIVIDGASQDNSKEILETFKKKVNKIHVIYSNKRKSTAFARNLGVRLSKSEYVAFLDSDDYWHENKLSEQINFMKKYNYDFTYTDYQPFFLKNNNKIFKKKVIPSCSYTFDQFINDTSIATSSMIVKKSVIGSIKCANIKILEDYPFKCQILKKVSSGIKLKQNLMFYRISENSLQSSKLRNVRWLWYTNRKYNKLLLIKTIISILMISISLLVSAKLSESKATMTFLLVVIENLILNHLFFYVVFY